MKVKAGEVFKAHNRYMKPPKVKYHLCIAKDMYFIINTKPAEFNHIITPADCSLLDHESHINLTNIRVEPIREFKIIDKKALSVDFIQCLIDKLRIIPSIPPIQKQKAIDELSTCFPTTDSRL